MHIQSRIFMVAAGLVAGVALTAAAAAQPGPGAGGPGRGPGMMGPGAGMMGPGMMGHHGMMSDQGNWCGGCGMMMRGWGRRTDLNLSAADVKAYLERMLQWNGQSRLKVGPVTETNADTITADVVTVDREVLAQRYVFDRHTGSYRPG